MVAFSSVAAGVLTFNRKVILADCIEGILKQTLPPDRLLILDNGSTDRTREYLLERGYLAHARTAYAALPENAGPASGFRHLFEELYALGCGWLWLMDDDVIPTPTALEELKRAVVDNFRSPEEIGYLLSAAVGRDGRAISVPLVDGRNKGTACPEWSHLLAASMVRVTEAPFTSILFPRETIRDFGLPRADFYMWGEDSDYTLRVTSNRPGYLVGKSIVHHLRTVPGDLNIRSEVDPVRLGNFYYLERNRIYLARTYYPTRIFLLQILRSLYRAVRFLISGDGRMALSWTVLRGLFGGLLFHPRR